MFIIIVHINTGIGLLDKKQLLLDSVFDEIKFDEYNVASEDTLKKHSKELFKTILANTEDWTFKLSPSSTFIKQERVEEINILKNISHNSIT